MARNKSDTKKSDTKKIVETLRHDEATRKNIPTSHQITMRADQLLGPELSDVDGNAEERRGMVSVFTCHSEVRQPGRGTQRCRRLADRTQQRGRDAS